MTFSASDSLTVNITLRPDQQCSLDIVVPDVLHQHAFRLGAQLDHISTALGQARQLDRLSSSVMTYHARRQLRQDIDIDQAIPRPCYPADNLVTRVQLSVLACGQDCV